MSMTLSPQRLRPRSLPGGPTWVERSSVSIRRDALLAKCALLSGGGLLLEFGIVLLGGDNTQGVRLVLGGIALVGWGFAAPLRYAVDLHDRGSTIRSLLTTHDAGFAGRINRLINQGLANLAAMPTYRIDPKRRLIDAD
jgi:hypothetical protein